MVESSIVWMAVSGKLVGILRCAEAPKIQVPATAVQVLMILNAPAPSLLFFCRDVAPTQAEELRNGRGTDGALEVGLSSYYQ